MSIIQSIILGIIQGLTEFLPISSSAHLITIPWILHWPEHSLIFDVALHWGTLFALIFCFGKDWFGLICAGLGINRPYLLFLERQGVRKVYRNLFWFLVVASIPAGIAGIFLEKYVETVFRLPLIIGMMTILLALILFWADKKGKKDKTEEKIGFWQSLFIGLSQVLALIPGVSRSGITISAGLLVGLDRRGAARFSFLLATPIILGAGLWQIKNLFINGFKPLDFNFVIGFFTALISGIIAIKFLLKYLETKSYNIFVWYRLLFGGFILSLFFVRDISNLLTIISNGIINTISGVGYLGVVFLMAIESACIPLPSEIIMPFAGYLVFLGRFNLWWTGIFGALGCVIGSLIAYWIGYSGGRRVVEKYGRYILISSHDLELADRWFNKYGELTVFFSRLLPIIRTFISLPAGIARMDFWRFLIFTFIGSLPWCLGLAYLGQILGQNWENISFYFHRFDFAVGLIILLGIGLWVGRHVKNLKYQKSNIKNDNDKEKGN